MRSTLRQHRAVLAAALVTVLVAAVVVVIALRQDGYQSRHVALNDGGVWVTSDQQGLFGRLNKPAGALDLALNPPGGAQTDYHLDLRQQDAAVVAWDQGTGRLLPVDPSAGTVSGDAAVSVSTGEQVELRGGTLAVLDPATGRVWAQRVDPVGGITSLTALDPSHKPLVNTKTSSALAVGTDGTIYVATASGRMTTLRPTAVAFAEPVTAPFAAAAPSVQVSVVGSTPVVLDPATGTVTLPGHRTVRIPADGASVIQSASDAAGDVAVATTAGLYAVPLGGGKARALYQGVRGTPAVPARVGDCVHAAWAGTPGIYVRACGTSAGRRLPIAGALTAPVFRVNRGYILLNDLVLGSVYDLDSLQEVDNWQAVKPPPVVRVSNRNRNQNIDTSPRDLPPKAVDDDLGARPGRTTVLHVLDNDSDPQGAILAVRSVTAASGTPVTLAIAPDGQSVEATLPPDASGSARFGYTVDDGRGLNGTATVTVEVRGPDENQAPAPRRGATPGVFSVSAGGRLDLPVLDDWRDFDGDPLVVTKATAQHGTVTTSPDGRIDYLAPGSGTSDTISYFVSDGRAAPVKASVRVDVLAPTSPKTAPPVAEPDIARGQVGSPITIDPLANDLPGADPTNPDAALAIAGTIPSPAGAQVTTDLKTGTVTFTAARHGTYLLSYTASFGNAAFSRAPIRVDVADAPPTPQPPVAVPDTGVLYGQNAAVIDVLANDFDPAGGVLVVQHAQPDRDNGQLEVSVVDGHWVRVAATVPTLGPNPQVVDYSVTDGRTAPVTGELTVTQVPAPDNDVPLAVDDYVTVRSGDSAVVPVLDNDIDPAGAPLALLDDVPGAPSPGALLVTPDDPASPPGRAWVSGKTVRFAAPVVARPAAETVTYVVHNPDGGRATGVVHVTVTPPPSAANPDQPPAAQPVEARAVSGDTIRITIPTSGVDPDGDTANVTGLTSAPTLGRVVAIGATSITYEAFPTTSGTDRFGYLIADADGKSASGTVSVGVAPASDPQPPVAVDDVITSAPGARVRADVLANDVIAPDDSVTIGDLRQTNPDLPPSIRLRGAGGPIELTAPAADGRSTEVQYSVSDGSGDPSVATLTVRSQKGYVPPPVAVDVPATVKPGQAQVKVDVLAHASDPQNLPLRVVQVLDPAAVVSGSVVTLPVVGRVQNVVFQIANSQGGTAAAVIHVPARGVGAPYAIAGRSITLGTDDRADISLKDYVLDPAGRPVRLTTTDQLQAAPATGLRLTSPDPAHLTITSVNGYHGPASITFQVTDGASLNDPNGRLAIITIPVQVGTDAPVVRCPTDPVQVVEGGRARALDVTALCHVWASDRARLASLRYTASWRKDPGGVDILGGGGHVVGLQAGGAARPGATGTLAIGVAGYRGAASTINVVVLPLGRATMRPIRIDGFKAGATASRDVRGYVSSPLRDPKISVVSVRQVSGLPARASATGSRVDIVPGARTHGILRFALVVTDVADRSRTDRQIPGSLTLEVLNRPDAPGAPQAGRTVLSRTVVLSWPTPAANGAPIDGYRVEWPGGAQACAASPCRIQNLTNGAHYAFRVRAHNAVGYSDPSPALNPPATPDALPGAPADLAVSNPQDHRVTLTWSPAPDTGTPVRTYRISWSGGGAYAVPGTVRTYSPSGLDNHNVYTFTVVAVNDLGPGPTTSAQGQSAGAPGTPTGVNVQYADAAGTTTRTVRVQWNGVDPNGPGPATYTVLRDNTPICEHVQVTNCTDQPATGQTYTYRVQAFNAPNHASGYGTAQFEVAGTPDSPGNPQSAFTSTDGQLVVSYTVPDPHGLNPVISCTYGGGGCGQWTPGGAVGSRDQHTVSGLPQDADVTITLHECNKQNYCSADASAPAAHTSGPPHAATGGGCGLSGQTVTWRWNAPNAINGYRVDSYRVSVDGGAVVTVNSTSYSKSMPRDGANHTARVTSVDSRGERSQNDLGVTCKAQDPPPPPQAVSVRPGTWTTAIAGCGGGCHAVDVTLSNFNPGQTVTLARTWMPATDTGPAYKTVTVDGNGSWSGVDGYYGGGNAGGDGHGTVTITVTGGGPSYSCYTDWHLSNNFSCN